MSFRMFRLFSSVFLLVIPEIYSQGWKVQYASTVKCALKGSSILLSSTYKHPADLTVTEIFWTVNPVRGEENIDLSDHPDYKGRVQYFAKKELSTFNLKLSNVTHKDEGMYCLRIVTNVEKQKHLGYPGVELKITELRVEVPEEVVEKHSAVLFCNSTCDLGGRNFTWYKNGKPLPETNANELFLPSVSSEDAGKYSCAVRDQKHLSSPAVNLNIRYQRTALYAAAGFGAAFICICIIIVLVKIMRRKKQDAESQGDVSKQDISSVIVTDQTSTCESKVQSDVMYMSVVHPRPEERQTAGDQDEVQYACVQHLRNTERTTEEPKPQHSHKSAESERADVIYSSVNTA